MTKHIVCHYKNGALLFCTVEDFPVSKAQKILEVFNGQGLTSVLERKSRSLFKVVGRLQLDYDPFVSGSISWSDVLLRMTDTLEVLEEKMKPFEGQQTLQRNEVS